MQAIIVFLSVAAACAAAAPASEEPIAIVSQDSEVNPDGSYTNNWESANGISFHEQGQVKPLDKDEVAQVVTGTAKWTDKDGTPIELTWVADENGFQPQGAHLPTPPPVPELPAWYLKAKEWSDAHPYDEEKELAKKYE